MTDKNTTHIESEPLYIDIVVAPSISKRKQCHDRFNTWDRDGNYLTQLSRTPFCDSARKLLSQGASRTAILRMFRANHDTPDVFAPITVAAALTVNETASRSPYLIKWRGYFPDDVPAKEPVKVDIGMELAVETN